MAAAAVAAPVKETAPTTPKDEKRRSLEIPQPKEVPNTLKIIEQGDDDITAMANEVNDRNISPSRSTGEIIPPPPPEFANAAQDDNEKRRSRKISKGSSIEDESEIKVQHRSSGGRTVPPGQHQEVRRSFSVDDRTTNSSPSSSVSSNKLNKSTITINDPSNSLASNTNNHVTVVTSHPPVIIDNSQPSIKKNKRLSKSLSSEIDSCNNNKNNEVVIVSNDTNKTHHVRESSTDDDYLSYDSLESSPKYNNSVNNNNNINNKPKARKLDESEVLIVSPGGIFEEEEGEENDTVDEIQNNTHNRTTTNNHLDTSHVSVVTVGDEQVKVKDSSHILRDSNSDLSNMSHGDGSTDGNHQDFIMNHSKTNGQMIYNSKRSNSSREDDVNIIVKGATVKKRISPDSSVDCSSSVDSPTRGQSENGSTRSSGQRVVNHNSSANHKNDRSDAESISTTTSHDSREKEPDDMEGVQLRRKEPDVTLVTPPSPKRTPRTKEEIQIANLKKKTRKRTRRFEIDGVQVTTTTSKVIYGDDENGKLYDDHIFRKQELRELKLLQKQEKKQFYDLQAKEQVAKDQQEKKFEQERLQLERTYESDMDILARQHKQQVEKFEQQQENELRNTSKKIRMEQERELKLVISSSFEQVRIHDFYLLFNFNSSVTL